LAIVLDPFLALWQRRSLTLRDNRPSLDKFLKNKRKSFSRPAADLAAIVGYSIDPCIPLKGSSRADGASAAVAFSVPSLKYQTEPAQYQGVPIR
jgi:hypothetical protein